jgi:GT2 family glycosyltransferase
MDSTVLSDRSTALGPASARPALSVVTVNWNSRDDLEACLSSLAAQTCAELEVLVIDNGSSDDSVKMVRARFPQFTLLEQTTNLGFAEGCNVGIQRATGAWIAMLNNDAIADPDWAKALVVAAERVPPSCGMLQSLMLFQRNPSTVNSTGIGLTHQGTGFDRDEGNAAPGDTASAPWEAIFCPTAGAAAYRRSMLDAIKLSTGYFDAGHFCYYEDLDLGWRARLAGYDAQYIPGSIVHHKYHGSTARRGRAWLVRLSTINRVRTLLKNASASFIARSLPTSCWQLFRLPFVSGPAALIEYASAIYGSLKLRAEVEASRRVERGSLEKRWAV